MICSWRVSWPDLSPQSRSQYGVRPRLWHFEPRFRLCSLSNRQFTTLPIFLTFRYLLTPFSLLFSLLYLICFILKVPLWSIEFTPVCSMPLEARVKSVLSGDTVVLSHVHNPAQERVLSLAYVSAPRLRREGDEVSLSLFHFAEMS